MMTKNGKKLLKLLYLVFVLCPIPSELMAQMVNDSNTPLHLMKPAYKVG